MVRIEGGFGLSSLAGGMARFGGDLLPRYPVLRGLSPGLNWFEARLFLGLVGDELNLTVASRLPLDDSIGV